MIGRIKSVRPLRPATARDCAHRNDLSGGRPLLEGDMVDGYGFISGKDGTDYYFHRTALPGRDLSDTLLGLHVEFDPVAHDKGPRAINVRLLTYTEVIALQSNSDASRSSLASSYRTSDSPPHTT